MVIPPDKIEALGDGSNNGNNNASNNDVNDTVGVVFLSLILLLVFFSLLRAQKRNRDLMREMMAMQADNQQK